MLNRLAGNPTNLTMTTLATDAEGYLINLDDWSTEAANTLAHSAGIELTEAHWEVLFLLREFYTEYGISPATRPFVKAVALKLGKEKGNSMYLMTLFSESPAKLAAKLAGLPKPTNCL